MHTYAQMLQVRESGSGTDVLIRIPDKRLKRMLIEKGCRDAEVRFDDGRHISNDQRKKIYATIKDIADWTGYMPEAAKEWLKYLHISRTGDDYFSLSGCSMDTAREFLNTLLEFAIEEGIPLSDPGVERAEDVEKYLYFCIKSKKCCVCGRPGEIHHVDRIGMGGNRRKIDDSNYRKMCLCREHHTLCHNMSQEQFDRMHHVYGIKV